jgi:Flp pilus assembly protein TadG
MGKINHRRAGEVGQILPPKWRACRLASMTGQDVVEFALVMPLFLLLTCGVIDFGRLFYVQMNLQQALMEAGRFASTGNHLPDPKTPGQNLSRVNSIIAEAQQYAAGALMMGATISNVQVSSVYGGSGSAGGPGDTVTISLIANFKLLTPIIAQSFPSGAYTFTSSVTCKNEPFPPGQHKIGSSNMAASRHPTSFACEDTSERIRPGGSRIRFHSAHSDNSLARRYRFRPRP